MLIKLLLCLKTLIGSYNRERQMNGWVDSKKKVNTDTVVWSIDYRLKSQLW